MSTLRRAQGVAATAALEAQGAGAVSGPPWLSVGVAALLAGATLGEGGARPGVELAVHGLVVILVVGALLAPPRPGPRLDAPGPLGAYAIFLALAWVGAAWAPYAYAAWETLVTLGLFAAVVWLAGRCGSALLNWIVPVLLGAAAVQGAFALFQRLAEGEVRPAGTFLNPNHLAAWLVAIVLLTLGSGPMSTRLSSVGRLALVLAAATGIALTGSRGALVAIAAGGGCLLATRWRHGRDRLVVAAVMAVLGIALAVALIARSSSFDPFRYHRVSIWRASLTAAVDHPWTGTGPGQFRAAAANLNFPLEGEVLRYERHFVSPHSDLVRLPAEFGFPAAIAMLLAVGLSARLLVRRRTGEPRTDAALAALVAIGAQAMVDDLTDRPAIWLLAGVLLGALLSREGQQRPWGHPRLRATTAVLLLLGFLVGDFGDYRAWRLRSAASARPQDATTLLGRAIELNPLRAETRLQSSELLAGGESWAVRDYAEARETAETGVRLQPAEARYRVGLAHVEARGFFELFGDADSRARFDRHYREAAALARHDPFIAIEHAGLLLAASDPSGARRAAERALAIEPNAVLTHLLLAEILLASGEVERAARSLAKAESLARLHAGHPKETPYARQLLTLDENRAAAIRSVIEGGALPFDPAGRPDGAEQDPA